MKIREVALGSLLLAALAVAFAPAADPEKGKGPTYKTPKAVGEAAMSALMKGDHKAFLNCLSKEAQAQKAAEFASKGLDRIRTVMLNRDNPKAKKGKDDGQAERDAQRAKREKPIFDALAKHGLTEKSTAAIKYDESAERVEKVNRALLALVKDPKAFTLDYWAAVDKASGMVYDPKNSPTNTIEDVKIDGDKAKGTLVQAMFGRKREIPMTFVKVGDGWKVGPMPRRRAGPGTTTTRPKE